VLLFALVALLRVDGTRLSLYDASLSEWAVDELLPMGSVAPHADA
jgi:hypothetical protein